MTTFVLVHGSYQGGWIWQRVASRLRAAGHTVYAPTMEGCAERRHELRPGIDTSTYVAEIADLLFYEDLHDVVLVGTSSGGMVVCGAAERMRHRVARLVLVDALALFNGERTRDIVKRASTGPAVLASAPSREDVEKGLFADLDPATRAWVLDRYTPHPTGCSETPVRLTDFGDQTSSRLAVIALMNAAPSGSSLSARPNTVTRSAPDSFVSTRIAMSIGGVFLKPTMRFTRQGTATVAGVTCTDWKVKSAEADEDAGSACVTDDGVALRMTGANASQTSLIATAIVYGRATRRSVQRSTRFQTQGRAMSAARMPAGRIRYTGCRQ